jgi:hypothetical protein
MGRLEGEQFLDQKLKIKWLLERIGKRMGGVGI